MKLSVDHVAEIYCIVVLLPVRPERCVTYSAVIIRTGGTV